jgi:hypothetical protein
MRFAIVFLLAGLALTWLTGLSPAPQGQTIEMLGYQDCTGLNCKDRLCAFNADPKREYRTGDYFCFLCSSGPKKANIPLVQTRIGDCAGIAQPG